jgi:hypothetical protein
MRSETRIKKLEINDQIEAFFAKGGLVQQCPAGSAIRDDDGMTPKQIDQKTWAVRMEKLNERI